MKTEENLTPCNKNCQLKNNHCLGCGRTLMQIANWHYYNENDKLRIIEENKNNHRGSNATEQRTEF